MIIIENSLRKLLGTGNALFYSIIKKHNFKISQQELGKEYGLSVPFQMHKEKFFTNANIVSSRTKTMFKVDENALNYVLYLYSVAGYCSPDYSGENFEVISTTNHLLSIVGGDIQEQVETKPDVPKERNIDVETIVDIWNEKLASNLGKITQKNKSIRGKIKARIKSIGIEEVEKALAQLEKDKYIHKVSWLNSNFVFRSDDSIYKINSQWMAWKKGDGSENFNESDIKSELDEFEKLMNG